LSIELRHITRTFGPFTALRDVSLTVPTGELVALLGPSGSGKTTLLRIIAGLEVPDENPDAAILFHDQDVAGQHVGLRGVGFVFQHYALFRHMTVFENIAFGLRVKPRWVRPTRSAIRHKVRELLRLIQLEGLEERYPSQLSGGQRKRVALARALAVEPKVLLLDEPFGALDARVRQELRQWLRRLHDEIHVTSVFVTHDQEEALEVADRVVVLNAGRIEQEGTPDDVFHHPQSAFVMEFLGRVNVFHGRVDTGRAFVRGMPLAVGERCGLAGDGDAKIFVRPHEFDLSTHPQNGSSFRGTVMHLNTAGPIVRLEVQTEAAGALCIEVPQDEQSRLGLVVGSVVFVRPREAHAFPPDFSI
jgi:sulfate/thiosulfate transport system ATP-binding protein